MHSLLKALVLFQFDKQAEKLQLAYDDALQMMAAAVPEVWPEGLQNNHAPVTSSLRCDWFAERSAQAVCQQRESSLVFGKFSSA